MKVLEYFGHEAFLEYSSFITEINELGFDREISGYFQIFSIIFLLQKSLK